MKEWCCIIALVFLLISILANVKDQQNMNHNSYLYYPTNNTAIYSRDTLQQIVINEELKIVNNIVKSITYGILYEAGHARKTYQWKDIDNVLNGKLYDKVFDEICMKFPDVNIEEFDGYTIMFNWQ